MLTIRQDVTLRGGIIVGQQRKQVVCQERITELFSKHTFKDDEACMFLLDFENKFYTVTESAKFKYQIKKGSTNKLEEIFEGFICEDDLQRVIHTFTLLENNLIRNKNLVCSCYTKDGNIEPVAIYCESVKNSLGEYRIVVGTIGCVKDDLGAQKEGRILPETQFVEDFRVLSHVTTRRTGYLMKIGIDNMKEIHEKYGMETIEMILNNTFNCMKRSLEPNANIYRAGTENFYILRTGGESLKDAEETYSAINHEVMICNENVDYPIYYTLSAGAIEYDSMESDYVEICKKVDFAFNNAMRRGKNQVWLFEQKEYEEYIEILDIEEKLRKDIKNGFSGFEVYYQPIVDVITEQLTGAEALLRWKMSEDKCLPPSVFIPILEDSGMIVPVGRWVMENAVKQCKEWQKSISGFRMNINLSYIQMKKSDIAYDVLDNLKKCELDSKYVLFEITESKYLETDPTMRHIMKSFQKKKIKLGLDDFGTGYSNFCHLNELRVNIIKIDRSFSMKAMRSNYHYKLLKNIIDMAHSINLKVCIEGIEEAEELQVMRELKPDYIQGYYYGRPVGCEEFYKKNIQLRQVNA